MEKYSHELRHTGTVIANADAVIKWADDKFDDNYALEESIGLSVACGVHRAVHRHNAQSFSVKFYEKAKLTKEKEEFVLNDILFKQQVHHVNSLLLVEAYNEADRIYLVHQYLGEDCMSLWDYIYEGWDLDEHAIGNITY